MARRKQDDEGGSASRGKRGAGTGSGEGSGAAGARGGRAPKPPVEVVRRRPDERKRLPAELEAFAAGDDDALWRRARRGGRIDDPRPVAATLVTGVANRDARLVGEARVRRLRAAIEAGDEAALGEELADAVRLAIWKALNVVGFDVLADAVLGIEAKRARALAKARAAELGETCEPADEKTIALWMRTEAGLLEVAPDARAVLRGGRLRIDVPFARAAEALSGVGRRAAPLAKPGGPDVVIDRPKGVAPLSRIIERDRPRDE